MSRGVLVDSHVLLWAMRGSSRLGKRAIRTLEQPHVHYSPLSLAELRLKAQKKNLATSEDLPEALSQAGFREVPVTSHAAWAVSRFTQLLRHDPFDLLLLSQAMTEDLDFLTADMVLLGLNLPLVKDATV